MKLIIFAIQMLFNFHSLFASSPIDDRFYQKGEFNVYTTLYDDPYVNYDAPPPPPPPPDGGIGGTTPGGEAVIISQNLPALAFIAFVIIIYYYSNGLKNFSNFNVKEKIIKLKKKFSISKKKI